GAVEGAHQMEQRRLARSGRADDRDQLALPDAEAHAAQGRHPRLRPIRLRDRVELEHGAHADGTTTCWPATSVESVTWTRPSASSNRPRPTATSRWMPAPSTVSTAYPPPASASNAVTGTTSAFFTLAVTIDTWT